MARSFFLSDGSSHKFWKVEVAGSVVRTHFGRIGTKGQVAERREQSAAKARVAAGKLVKEKLGKGYVEGSPPKGAPPPSRTSKPKSKPKPKVKRGKLYDNADYHSDSCDEHHLAPHQAYVHTGLFVTWLVQHEELLDPEIRKHLAKSISAVQKRKRTGPQFYAEELDGVLVDDWLSDEGSAFTNAYFDFSRGKYLNDYHEIFHVDPKKPATEFSVKDTWTNYAKLRPRLDQRFAAWKGGESVAKNA